MAKRVQKQKGALIYCRDCVHSYDPYCMNYKNEPIMCKCRLSEYAKLLNQKGCANYKARTLLNR